MYGSLADAATKAPQIAAGLATSGLLAMQQSDAKLLADAGEEDSTELVRCAGLPCSHQRCEFAGLLNPGFVCTHAPTH